MADIVPIRGMEVRPAGEPDPEMVQILEKLLAQARRGEIAAIGYAVVAPNTEIATGWLGLSGTRYTLGGAIGMLELRYRHALVQG
ncbi:hypothetical protein [Chelatococcus asaccharovorans]|uniref:Uncharacterized protein n=1 Tax=Chelatococcus asaccharovorans TaxID=28210 RepID=A0A2V3UBQ5_9HYPH|nr:hypothetical protein [Chelatococcus asaccharovorans]MBS7703307.1 hypothetical protein [Chelatococcus asaccharovorans]PXW61641.1 hypothetical protein C7450_103158 [Chelatococcus asaccharovorans]